MRIKIFLTLFLLLIGIVVVRADDFLINETQAHLLANKMIANVEEVIRFRAQRYIPGESRTCFENKDGVNIQLLPLTDDSQLTDFQKSLVTKLKREKSKQITKSDSRFYYTLKAIESSGRICIKCHDSNSQLIQLRAHVAIFVTIPINHEIN
ncbi:MAG: hypothetical protein GY928_04795 [Colwellia sp.]|nr:hypothetical protein [Colwellia sp.]